jgi:hypothetical protein
MIMNRFIFHSLIIVFGLTTSGIFSQSDTVYKKKHYNYIEYYSDKKVKLLGNMKDSMKSGDWIYFKQNGKLLAEGTYLNGKKIGKWTYIDYKNKKHSHKWEPDAQPDERMVFEKGQLVMYDHLSTRDQTGSVSLNFKFGELDYYILD